ncbi:hypothetical protein GF302_001819 [Enterococcus faecalis]|nr:hypothetical protein [Enterococcus faecalis]
MDIVAMEIYDLIQ